MDRILWKLEGCLVKKYTEHEGTYYFEPAKSWVFTFAVMIW